MPETRERPHTPGFDRALADLAERAGDAARGASPAQLRHRANRAAARRRIAAGAVAVAVLGVVGVTTLHLTGDEPRPAPPGTPSTGATATSSPAGSPSGSPSMAPDGATGGSPSNPATGPAGSVSTCTLDRLRIGSRTDSSGSGHRSVVLTFTNRGDTACHLRGYPGVAGLDGSDRQVAQARRKPSGYLGGLRSGSVPPEVTIRPGETASAMVEALAFNADSGAACTPYAGLLVTPPDETSSVRVGWNSDGCDALEVHPVVPGSTGRQDQ